MRQFKYVNVINKYTKRPVPYTVDPNGEICIISTNPLDNDETCIVRLTNVFCEHSHDVNGWPSRVG